MNNDDLDDELDAIYDAEVNDDELENFWIIAKINTKNLPKEKLQELKELFEELSYDWRDKPEN